jgi:EmrB/QacA subfamily drug resistance transporter
MTTVGAHPETYGIPPDVFHRRKAILAVLCISLVIVVIAVASLNVALPTLQRELGASPTQLQWIVDAYGLVFAGTLLLAGALGDRYGRKGALQAGLGIFATFALIASQATSPEMLIATRTVMGLGAALIMPSTLSIITNSFPPHERQWAIATWAGFAGAGSALGPIVSGLLLEHFWWGSIFFLNIPLIAVLLVLTTVIVPTSKDPHGHPLDVVGALLSVVGLVALVFAIIQGPEWGWSSPGVLAAFGTAAVFLCLFVWWELRSQTPMLDPRLFRLPGFGMGSLAITLSFFCMFGMFFMVTQYLQYVHGDSPLVAGLKTLPAGATLILVSPRSPRVVARIGVRHTLRIGFGLLTVGLLVFGLLQVSSGYGQFLIAIVCLGAGLALLMPPATGSIVSSLPLSKAGVGSAVNDVTREVGGALGIAVLGSILNSVFTSNVGLGPTAASLPPAAHDRLAAAGDAIREGIGQALGVAGEVAKQPFPGAPRVAAEIVDAAKSAFVDGTSAAFFTAAAVATIAGIVVTSRIPDQIEMGPAHEPAPIPQQVTPAVGST